MPKYTRKTRKTAKKVPRRDKPYCPWTMVRYDDTSSNFNYKPVWVCKMCLKFLFDEENVRNHVEICNTRTNQQVQPPTQPPPPPPQPTIRRENDGYVCQYCSKIFSRWVVIKKHVEGHEITNSGSDVDSID